MAQRERIVILGGGPAGWSTCWFLRDKGFDGVVELVTNEPHLPYDRPPLSKGFLRGEMPATDLPLRPASWYAENDITVHLGTTVDRVDAHRRLLACRDGSHISYDKLLVATGARPRQLPAPGSDLDGVISLRTLGDAEELRQTLQTTSHLVVVGAGFIGSEVAASARALGIRVTLVETLSVPLAGALGEPMGEICAAIHRENDVDLRTGVAVAGMEGNGRVERVRMVSGDVIDCDLVVVGVGVVPNIEPVLGAGVAIDHGIVVDEYCRTTVDGIYAAGDVTRHFHPLFGWVQVEHWQNAIQHGAAAALNMLAERRPYSDVHWFWSDQYEHNLQYAGHAQSWDDIVLRGSTANRNFVAFYLANDRVRAIFALNRGRDLRRAISLISSENRVDRALLRDDDVSLRELTRRQPAVPAGE